MQRLRTTHDGEGVARACAAACGSLAGAQGVLCQWRCCPENSSETQRAVWWGGAEHESLLELDLTDWSRQGNDHIESHGVTTDPSLDGLLVREALVRAGFTTSLAATVHGADGTPALVVRCLFLGDDGRLVDADREVLMAVAREAAQCIRSISLERRLAEVESRLASIGGSVVDAIVTIDGHGVITSVNEAVSRMFGYEASQLVGRDVVVLMSEADRDSHRRAIEHRRSRPRTSSSVIGRARELEAHRKDGSVFPIELSISPIEGTDGFVGVIRDVTGRKAAEQRMREADRLAAIGTLAAGLGHDMNNMLFPIRAHLNALVAIEAPDDMAADIEQHAEQIARGVAYLQQLADALHFLALDPDGDGDGDSTTDLSAWWTTCGALLGRAVYRRATLKVELDCELPEVFIPQHALTRAVLNLLTNAAEAMPTGRAPNECVIELRARRGRTGAGVVLEVVDNGCGMSEEIRRRATDVFFTTRTRGLGTGLGLSLVHRVVTRAGGRLELDSAEDRGTVARLVLPSAVLDEEPATERVRVELREGRTRAIVIAILESAGITVLVDRENAEHLAEECLALVVDAESFDEALLAEWLRHHPAGSIVVIGNDVRMDAMRGAIDGVRRVRDEKDYAAIEQALLAAVESRLQESVIGEVGGGTGNNKEKVDG
jgi:PAS domain S-box-containing protein